MLTSGTLQSLERSLPAADSIDVLSYHIYGFCDDVGSEDYNLKLSQKRAQELAGSISDIRKYNARPNIHPEGEIPLSSDRLGPDEKETERKQHRKSVLVLVYRERELQLADMELGTKMVLDNILFVGGKRQFLPESVPALEELVRKLKASPEVKINIIGHVCCTGGPDGLDLETGKSDLSEVRARTVYLYLIDHGIEKDRLRYEGRGGSEPLGKNYELDRRVEIEITGK